MQNVWVFSQKFCVSSRNFASSAKILAFSLKSIAFPWEALHSLVKDLHCLAKVLRSLEKGSLAKHLCSLENHSIPSRNITFSCKTFALSHKCIVFPWETLFEHREVHFHSAIFLHFCRNWMFIIILYWVAYIYKIVLSIFNSKSRFRLIQSRINRCSSPSNNYSVLAKFEHMMCHNPNHFIF